MEYKRKTVFLSFNSYDQEICTLYTCDCAYIHLAPHELRLSVNNCTTYTGILINMDKCLFFIGAFSFMASREWI